MSEQHRPDLRLYPAAAVAWATAWVAVAQSAQPALLTAASLASVALTGAALLGPTRRATRRGYRWVGQPVAASAVLVAAAGAAVCATAAAGLADREAGSLDEWAASRRTVELVGTVRTDPQRLRHAERGERWWFRLEVERAAARGQRTAARTSVVLIGGPQWSSAVVGSRVRAVGRLSPTDPGQRPVAVLSALGSPTQLAPPGRSWAAAESIRAGLRAVCARMGSDAGGLVPAMVVGDTSRLSPELETAMRAAGLTHLTAVSGTNLAILVAAVVASAVVLRLPRWARVVLTAAAIAAFILVARPEPSVVRAAAMGGVVLLAVMIGRPSRAAPALAAAVLLLLVADPWLSRSPGFALSASATAGLILLCPRLARRWARLLPRPVALALAAPVAAQLACTPVLLFLGPGVNWVAVPANLLAGPAVALVTLAGALTAVLAQLSLPAARLVSMPAEWSAQWIGAVARWGAQVPGGTLPWPSGARGSLLFLAAAGSCALLGRWWVSRSTRAFGARSTVPLAALLAGLALVGIGSGWPLRLAHWGAPGSAWPPPGWAVAQCDVGQGSAIAVPTGPGRAMLIDVGPADAGLPACLRALGVRRVAAVFLTHLHADHAGGLAEVLRRYPVEAVVAAPGSGDPAAASALRRLTTRARVPLRLAAAGSGGGFDSAGRAVPAELAGPGAHRRGQPGGLAPVVRWRALWPPTGPVDADFANAVGTTDFADAVGTAAPGDESAINNASLVLEVSVGATRVVALGDVEEAAQRELLRRGEAGRADVVVVAHHGSARQVPELYQLLRPRVALLGVGAGNTYGHPNPRALRLFTDTAVVVRSDLHGDAVVAKQGGGLMVAVRGA